MKLIKESFSEDLRKKEWKQTNCIINNKLDRYEQDFEATDGNKYHTETKFCGYDDAWGNPVIAYQFLYEVG